jgi:serine/threonine-protein kinase
VTSEQARGRPLDKRSDIWSFGCVLYEALARKRAFHGETVSDYIAAILDQEPDWKALPAATPPAVGRLLRRCLEKEPQRRLRDIGDARIELEEALAAPARAVTEEKAARPRSLRLAVGCVLAGALVAAMALSFFRPRAPSPPVTRFAIMLPQDEVVSPTGGPSVRLSPDGAKLVWVGEHVSGRRQIYTRRLDQLEAKPVAGTLAAVSPFLSPDGNWLGFRDTPSRSFKKVAFSGGAPVTICPSEVSGNANWQIDDKVYFRPGYPAGIVRVSSSGGTPEPVTRLDEKKEEQSHSGAVLLPGGKAVLFTAGGGGMDSYDDARIVAQVLATGERKVLIEGGMAATYSPTGHIIYARGGKLLAVPFNPDRLEVTGGPIPVVDGLFMCPNTGVAHFSLAANGTLAYAQGMVLGGERRPVWVDRRGKAEPLPMPARSYLHPRLSPDGKLLAIEIEGPTHDFWIFDFGRGTMTKVTLDGVSHWPLWTPDGSRLTYRVWSQGHFSMWWMPSDRSSAPERLFEDPHSQSASSWSPDGKAVAFTQINLDTGTDVYVMRLDGDRKPRPFAQTRFPEGSPKFSPDGRWIAYTSSESGRNEIYVQAYPGPGAKIQVSTDGGTDAVWKRNGGELYYRNGDKMMAVQVHTAGSFQASKPALLWTGRYAHGLGSACGAPGTTSSNYDVTADGQRFLMIQHDEQAPAQINVVVNWTEELKRLMAAKKS